MLHHHFQVSTYFIHVVEFVMVCFDKPPIPTHYHHFDDKHGSQWDIPHLSATFQFHDPVISPIFGRTPV